MKAATTLVVGSLRPNVLMAKLAFAAAAAVRMLLCWTTLVSRGAHAQQGEFSKSSPAT